MLRGYARVSTDGQDVAMQVAALRRAGVRLIAQETRSGALDLPQRDALLQRLKPGDGLVVYKVDRLARSLRGLLDVADRVNKAGASLRSLTEPIDTGTPIGRAFFQLLGVFSELERALIRERCMAGRVEAVARGVAFGRPRLFDYAEARRLRDKGLTWAEVGRCVGRPRETVRKALLREAQR